MNKKAKLIMRAGGEEEQIKNKFTCCSFMRCFKLGFLSFIDFFFSLTWGDITASPMGQLVRCCC